jgi:hypothetical protein
MGFYRKKPIVIEARQFDGTFESALEIEQWSEGRVVPVYAGAGNFDHFMTCYTIEGAMSVYRNAFVIKGVKGEFYPCEDQIFEMTYDKEKQE